MSRDDTAAARAMLVRLFPGRHFTLILGEQIVAAPPDGLARFSFISNADRPGVIAVLEGFLASLKPRETRQ